MYDLYVYKPAVIEPYYNICRSAHCWLAACVTDWHIGPLMSRNVLKSIVVQYYVMCHAEIILCLDVQCFHWYGELGVLTLGHFVL